MEYKKYTIMECYRGSITHNLELEKPRNGFVTGDVDKLILYCFPQDYYFSLESYYNKDRVEEYKQDKDDFVFYELQKCFHLLIHLNPNVTPILYLKPEHYLHTTPAFELLLEKRHLFDDKTRIRNNYLGYARGQKEKIVSRQSYLGYQGEKRKQLYEKIGYDAKSASHAIRLLRVAQEWLQDGEPQIYRTHDREELLSIKCGEYSLDQVLRLFDQEIAKTEQAYLNSHLPEENDRDQLNRLLLDVFSLSQEMIASHPENQVQNLQG